MNSLNLHLVPISYLNRFLMMNFLVLTFTMFLALTLNFNLSVLGCPSLYIVEYYEPFKGLSSYEEHIVTLGITLVKL